MNELIADKEAQPKEQQRKVNRVHLHQLTISGTIPADLDERKGSRTVNHQTKINFTSSRRKSEKPQKSSNSIGNGVSSPRDRQH